MEHWTSSWEHVGRHECEHHREAPSRKTKTDLLEYYREVRPCCRRKSLLDGSNLVHRQAKIATFLWVLSGLRCRLAVGAK